MNNQKIVLIVGASSFLGQRIVKHLDSKGFVVYSGYNSSAPNQLKGNWIKLDVTSNKSINLGVSRIVKKEGKIDVLIYCVGLSMSGRVDKSTIDEFDKLLNINTKGSYLLTKKVLPLMKQQKFGRIINITSMSGLISFPNFGIYSASKFALEALNTALRYEVINDNIWVTNIEPGAIQSESVEPKQMSHKTFRERFLLARWLLPLVEAEDVAQKIGEVIDSSKPPLNVFVGRDVKLVSFAKKIIPSHFWDLLLRKLMT